MKKLIGNIFLAIMGWKFKENIDLSKIKKAVLIAAPHTSNWDFPIAIAAMWTINVDLKFLIKDSYTKKWYGGFFRKLGAIGVDRSNLKGNKITECSADLLKKNDLMLIIPAEGTRNRVEQWKKGFYHISKEADVPIVLAYLDYKKKEAGLGKLIYHKDQSLEELFDEIQFFYSKINGKFPKKYNPKIY